jgi:ligand-binding sensor domain-containing protein
MKTRAMLLVGGVSLVVGQSLAAVGIWKNFTSMKDVRDITHAGSVYWAATSGGLFAWNTEDNSYKLFTNAEGLRTIDLTAVEVDEQGDIWTGSTIGILHVYSPRDRSWRYISDIANSSEYTNKTINGLAISGNTVFICAEFGLSTFRINTFGFGDTYKQFGSLQGNVNVSVSSVVVFDDSIRATVTDNQNVSRVAIASLAEQNLLPPEAWTLQIVGNAATVPEHLAVFNGLLFAGTNSGLYVYGAGIWNAVPGLSGQHIIGLSDSQSFLHVVTQNQVFTVDGQLNVQQIGGTLPFFATCIASSPEGQPLVGSTGGGILSNGTNWNSHIPNGPNSNLFFSIAVDQNGNIWGASGNDGGHGFYRYNGRDWKTFFSGNSPLPTDNYYRVSTACNGSVWLSSWGQGVLEIPPGTDAVDTTRIYGKNVGMAGLPNDTNYVVISSVVCDGQGNTWMAITKASDSKILAIRKPNRTWTTVAARVGSIPISTLQDNVPVDRSFAVDGYDNLWGVARTGNLRGAFSLGNGGTITDTVMYFLTSNDGLPSNEITTIVADLDKNIWIGTDKGIAIILDTFNPKRSGAIASYVPLDGVPINTIAVDPLNQKWVGTPNGVVVLSPDGTQVIENYTVLSTNGKLIDDDVKSIAFDGNSGTAYFGTFSGLSSLTTVAASPKPTFDELTVSPNPFRIPSSSPLTVDGLAENSTLKILSIDGRLIREIKTPGGRLGFWDGRDDQGNLVSSGVYLVVASSEQNTSVGKAKIAVIRR